MMRGMLRPLTAFLCALSIAVSAQAPPTLSDRAKTEAGRRTRQMIQDAPKLPLTETELAVPPQDPRFSLGMVSWISRDRNGTVYLIQRGDKADPVIAIDSRGRILRSWGKGMYALPHAIRVDPQGSVWTVDANSSMVYKFSAAGEKQLGITVGGQPAATQSPFVGTTDVAFGPGGRVFVSDGYGNARVIEYTADGRKVKEWGSHGTGPGQFNLPHSIVVDADGVIYVADRENGRIERFTLDGAYLGEWPIGKAYSLQVAGDAIWAGMHPVDEPTASPGWLVKIDRHTGRILGYVDVPEKSGLHSVEITAGGEPMTVVTSHVIWFRGKS
jgi:hypothetical protein